MFHKIIYFLMIMVYAFLYVPMLCMVIFSFSSSPTLGQWSEFSCVWYLKLLHHPQLLESLVVSLKVACISASLAVILGTFTAVALARTTPRRFFLEWLSFSPLMVPEIVLGLSFLVFFVTSEYLIAWPHGRGLQTLIIAHTTLSITYVTVVVQSRLKELDSALEEAALDLGARPLKVFFVITLPLISPALLSGGLMAFAVSLDDLIISSFISGPGSSTLPMVIFSSMRAGLTPQINALGTLMIALAMIAAACWGGMFLQRKKRVNSSR